MNAECLFCKIAEGTIPSTVVYADDEVVAFNDIHPVAPVHVLIVPRRHVASVAELADGDARLVESMITRARAIAEEKGIAGSGYRLVFNVRDHGGQVVDHLHLHLIGGKKLGPMA